MGNTMLFYINVNIYIISQVVYRSVGLRAVYFEIRRLKQKARCVFRFAPG